SPISMNVDVYFRRASLFHTFFVERSDRCHFAFWQTAPRKQGRGPLLGESGSDPLVSAGGVVRQPMTRLDFRIPGSGHPAPSTTGQATGPSRRESRAQGWAAPADYREHLIDDATFRILVSEFLHQAFGEILKAAAHSMELVDDRRPHQRAGWLRSVLASPSAPLIFWPLSLGLPCSLHLRT